MNIQIKSCLKEYFTCVISFLITTFLMRIPLSPVLSSALVGFIASFVIPQKIKNQQMLVAIAYCASFAAIGFDSFKPAYWDYLILITLVSALFHYSKNLVVGFGGKLGTIAFLSTGGWYLISRLLW